MTKLTITYTKYWTDMNDVKVAQVEHMACTIIKEDANWIEFNVDEVLAVDNAAPFYKATKGGAVMKRFLNGYEGKVGMFTLALA